jgi:hypothetical protein
MASVLLKDLSLFQSVHSTVHIILYTYSTLVVGKWQNKDLTLRQSTIWVRRKEQENLRNSKVVCVCLCTVTTYKAFLSICILHLTSSLTTIIIIKLSYS